MRFVPIANELLCCSRRAGGRTVFSFSFSCVSNAGWEDQLAKLEQYKAAHGDCIVPTHWAEGPGLGAWVCTQRTLKNTLDRGEPCMGMTAVTPVHFIFHRLC